MPDGPMIYIAERAEPGVVNLRRWFIRQDVTKYKRVGSPTSVFTENQGESKHGPWRTNPFGGKYGWTLHAMGKSAWKERGLTGTDDAKRLLEPFKRIPPEQRVHLQPRGYLPGPEPDTGYPGDPLLSGSSKFRPWVSDECIAGLIRAASPKLRFSVRAKQRELLPGSGGQRQYAEIFPIRYLQQAFQEGHQCDLVIPQGVSLSQAAKALGFADLRKVISIAPEKLYEAWRSRSERANDRQQRLLNLVYHRVLLHRFLRMRRLTPVIEGNRELSIEIERRARLMQAYRVFVFDRQGCPVAINTALLEANNLQVKTLMDKQIPHAEFTRYGPKARKFGAWVFTDVLRKRISECRSREVYGLEGLLAAAEELR